jgi:hypothetical protein
MQIQIQQFFTSALDGDECEASLSDRFTPSKNPIPFRQGVRGSVIGSGTMLRAGR